MLWDLVLPAVGQRGSQAFGITLRSQWAWWRLKSPAQRVFAQPYSGAYQRKHQSSASLAFVWVIHQRPVNSPHKGLVTRKMFPFDDVIMLGPQELRAPSQYPKRRLFVRSREVSKPRDWYFKLSYRFDIWQAHRQQCCRSACQISERSRNSKCKSRGFETLRGGGWSYIFRTLNSIPFFPDKSRYHRIITLSGLFRTCQAPDSAAEVDPIAHFGHFRSHLATCTW